MPSYSPGQIIEKLADKEVDWLADDLRWTLHTGAAPDQDVVDYFDDVAASELATGNGYTNGGQAATGKTVTYTAGTNGTKLDADDPVWTPAGGETLTARFAVLANHATGVDATAPVLYIVDFGVDTSATGADFTVALHADGIIAATVAAAA